MTAPPSQEALACASSFKEELVNLASTLLTELQENCLRSGVPTMFDSTTVPKLKIFLFFKDPSELIIPFLENTSEKVKDGKNYWDLILEQDKNSIPTCLSLFDGAAKEYAEHILFLLENPNVGTPFLFKSLWASLKKLCEEGIKYIHYRRGKKYDEKLGRYIYDQSYFDTVKVGAYVKLFDIRI